MVTIYTVRATLLQSSLSLNVRVKSTCGRGCNSNGTYDEFESARLSVGTWDGDEAYCSTPRAAVSVSSFF